MNELAELFELMCDMHKREWQVMDLRINFIILTWHWQLTWHFHLARTLAERTVKGLFNWEGAKHSKAIQQHGRRQAGFQRAHFWAAQYFKLTAGGSSGPSWSFHGAQSACKLNLLIHELWSPMSEFHPPTPDPRCFTECSCSNQITYILKKPRLNSFIT